ncbi:MAG: hypothetical protein EOO04_34515, partial [Chitinophagaceae bacterium]
MNKLYIFLGTLIMGTFVMAYVYFSRINQVNAGSARAISVATHNAAVVFEFTADKKFFDLMREQEITAELIGKGQSDALIQLKDYLYNDRTCREGLTGRKVMFGILADGDSTNLIIATQFADVSTASAVTQSLTDQGSLKPFKNGINTLLLNDSTQFYVAFKEDLLMISPEAHILRERLALDPDKPGKFHEYVDQRQQISKSKLLTGYFDFNTIKRLGSVFISGKLDGELNFLNSLNAFGELNYNFSKRKLQLYGTNIVQGEQNYIALFSQLNPVPITINNILPENTSSYKIFGIDDIKKFTGLLFQHLQE